MTRWGGNGGRFSGGFIFLSLYLWDLYNTCQKQEDDLDTLSWLIPRKGKGTSLPFQLEGSSGVIKLWALSFESFELLEGSRPNNDCLQSLFRVNGGQAQHHPQTCQPLLSTPKSWGNRSNSGMWDRQARRESFYFQTQAEKQIVCHYLVSAEVTKQNYEQAKINLPPDTWTWISSCSIWFIQLIKCRFSFIISR